MWAILDKKTQIVLGVLTPDAPMQEIKKINKNYDLILMTLQNSPAKIGDKYENGRFYSTNNIRE
jgi:hypothetical protein